MNTVLPVVRPAARADLTSVYSRGAHVGAVLVLSAAALVVFAPLARHPSDLVVGVQHGGQNDLTSAFLTYQQLPQVIARRTGEGSWWNPWLLGGGPWFGNPQAALCYPPNWLFRWGDPVRMISWMLLAHHLWGGCGAYLLARRWQLRWAAAVLSGVGFLAAPFLVAQTGEGHYNQICVVSWLPWTWLAWERLAASQRWGGAALAAALVAGFTAGHVQEWYYQLLLLAGLAAAEIVGRWRTGQRAEAWRLVRDAGLAVTLSIGLLAVELIPAVLYASQTVRGGRMAAAEAGQISLGLPSFRQLVDPLALGGPDQYRGPGHFYWETLFHFGMTPLVLAALALIVARRNRVTWRLAAVVAVTVAFAFGDGSPVFELVHRCVPGAGLFRAPSRALFLASLGVALLSGVAIHALCEFWGARSRRGLAVAVGPLALVLVLGGAVVVESTRLAQRIWLTVPASSFRDPAEWTSLITATPSAGRVLAEQSLLSDREACLAGIVKLQGYDPVPLVRQVALVDALTDAADASKLAMGFATINLAQLDIAVARAAGVRWAIVSPQRGPVDAAWTLRRRGQMPAEFQVRGRTGRELPYELYELSESLPRAYLVGTAVEAAPRDALELVAEIDPRRQVIVPRDVLPDLAGEKRCSYRDVELATSGAAVLAADVELDGPGYLVLQDTWTPGWQAEVDGTSVGVLPANVAGRAVPLDAGRHHVELRYRTPGLGVGCLGSLVSLVLLGGWSLRGLAGSRQQ